MKLLKESPLSKLLVSRGVFALKDAFRYIQALPYGRNSNRNDFSLVIKESKGTFSSKHAFLKSLIDELNLLGWDLIIGIFKMNKINTPEVAQILDVYNLDYLPEAHAYLRHKGVTYDFTNQNSSFEQIKEDIIEEVVINPNQVVEWKLTYHQRFLKNWIAQSSLIYNFEALWKIRETCIVKLSE